MCNFRWILGRAVWAAMMAAHAVWLVGALTKPAAGGFSSLSLLAAIAFFGLKVVDAPFLRIQPSRRTWIAMGLIVLLLHAGPLHRSIDPDGDWSFPWLPSAAAVGAIGSLRAVCRFRRFVPSLASILSRLQAASMHHCRVFFGAFCDVPALRLLYVSNSLAPPRAPPA